MLFNAFDLINKGLSRIKDKPLTLKIIIGHTFHIYVLGEVPTKLNMHT